MQPHFDMYRTLTGYVTVLVEVPPQLLMPGRRMVVTSPAGYPVQVAVPEGFATGTTIPVQVPAQMPFPPTPYPMHFYYPHRTMEP
jgi:hypothetical protein